MTEVAGLLVPSDHRITTVRHYEAGPPAGLELVEPGETIATTKEEEWVSKKKTEVTNTKQIETRVKRQVVLEDGKVVEDTGPMVTTNTTEDSETQEHHQTELRKLGDGDEVDGPNKKLEGPSNGALGDSSTKWVVVPNPDGLVREVKEKRVISREETEEVKETEDVHHYGDITDKDFLAAVRSGKKDLRQVLRTTDDTDHAVVSTGPRIIHESQKSNKVIDTEDTRELSSILADGKIVTETERTTEHEEIKDDELPEEAADQDYVKKNSQRFLKTREQEDVDFLSDGIKIGHEMRYRTETMEVERKGDGFDEIDFDSLSARARRRSNNTRQPHRYRGVENGPTPIDRKDALTRKPLDFDAEEETRKVETSKWLEHHFGSESRSSNNSTIDDEEQPPKTSFFNVTIKSQPTTSPPPQKTYVTTVNSTPRVYSPVEAERDRNHHVSDSYYKGISQWSERRQDHHFASPEASRISPIPHQYQERPSPIDNRIQQRSPIPDYNRSVSPKREVITTPTPPQRKRASERRQQHVVEERVRYDGGYRQSPLISNGRSEPLEEPPPDYSPPKPPPIPQEKKMQKTRFAPDPPKQKSGNIIGQSIRKLVGKIRSASAERKARQRAKRSPSPSYQKGHVIDNNIGHNNTMDNRQPVQRYYLGEDPFAGSIYGRENKYDGVRPARTSRRDRNNEEQHRSQSTLGRFSKSASRLGNSSVCEQRNSQTLPRHSSITTSRDYHNHRNEPPTRLEKKQKSNSTINVSIINTLSRPIQNEGPAKPARTYRSNLLRSKSLNVHADDLNYRKMYTSNPHLNRLNENPIGLKSPGLISSLSRSQKDVSEDFNSTANNAQSYTSRFTTQNGIGSNNNNTTIDNNKRVFLKSLKDRAPELFKTLHENEDDYNKTTPLHRNYNGDIYEPPTRLRDNNNHVVQVTAAPQSILRRGSNSSTDYSETYHTTTRNQDPYRPSITNTVTNISKKTIPSRNGRSLETIESSETKSVTKSSYNNANTNMNSVKFYDSERRYGTSGGAAPSPVVIEVRNNNSYRK